jgi:four helix bundle protein
MDVMVNTQKESNELLLKKAQELVDAILMLNDSIQDSELSQIKDYLREIAQSMPETLRKTMSVGRKIDKIRAVFVAQTSLEEAKDYLSLIERLRYASTKDILLQVEEVTKLLTNVA